MNNNTFEKLQYIELKETVKSYCVSQLGKEEMNKLMPSSDLEVVKLRLNETTEARAILDAGGNMPFMGVSNIENIINKLEKGLILTPSDLINVSDFLRGCRRIKNFMATREFLAPVLSTYVLSMTEMVAVEEEIDYAIKNSQVDSYANNALKRVRDQIHKIDQTIKEELNKFLKNKANKNYIQESIISMKNDRYTIPIKSAYKNQVQGTIIEVSSVGSTVFIEPKKIGKLIDELTSLKAEEEMIEYQILATLSGLVSENIQPIHINIELIAQYDMIFAKAKYSKSVNGIEPKINNYGYVRLIDCKHPLLVGDIVPLDFEIGKDYRSMVITGPNAGGKTIVLKTIGLITLATMSGFHIMGSEETEISIFDRIFVDLGDNQSIENSLSTFSSHMKNLSDILQAANNQTLLLFDEIGSGTEPNEGTAIAISLLEEFYHKGCITIATTHYGEIKNYSEVHSDFMNAAMQFNSETLEPLFKLLVGQSGESNALWISKKMNIPNPILKRAEKYMKSKDYRFNRVNENKILKPKKTSIKEKSYVNFEKGDRVNLLEYDDYGIVYESTSDNDFVTVFYQEKMLDVHIKRLKLELKAKDLYPDGYVLDSLFSDFKTRKLTHDIQRGSKKALRKIHKEIRENKMKNN